MKHFKAIPICLAAALLLSGAAVASSGGKSDPLVTISYLEDTVIPDLLKTLDRENKSAVKELKSDLADQIKSYEKDMKALVSGTEVGSDTYVLVTLTAGQTMALDVGCELMLRVGSASVTAGTSPALIDITTGGTIDSGVAMEKNHLYMATIPDRVLTANAETVKLLVRGGYTVA